MLASMSARHTFVLGTRYGKGVEMDKDWPMHRRIISAGARILALPLTTASDPMSGFFGIRKESVSTSYATTWPLTSCHVFQFLKARNLNSQGFKIALDLLIKAQISPDAIAEVPFSFGVRAEGESKLTGKVMIKYLEQLAELYWYKFSGLLIFLAIFLFIAFLVLLRTQFGAPSPEAQYK
jgi:dolichol-phosphate mannosyltransferase